MFSPLQPSASYIAVDCFTGKVLYQVTWAISHRQGHLVSCTGLAGQPRARKDSNTKGYSQ
jgi:hypothetical protein